MFTSSFTSVSEQVAKLKSEREKLSISKKRVSSLISAMESHKEELDIKHKMEVIKDELAEVSEKVTASKSSVISSRQAQDMHCINTPSLSLMSGKTLLLRDSLHSKMTSIQELISRLTRFNDELDRETIKTKLCEQVHALQEQICKELQKTRTELALYQEECTYNELLYKQEKKYVLNDNISTIVENCVEHAKARLDRSEVADCKEQNNIYMSFMSAIDEYAAQLRERLTRNVKDSATICEKNNKECDIASSYDATCMTRINTAYNKNIVLRAIDLYERAKAQLITSNKNLSISALHHRLCTVAERVQCVLPSLTTAEIDKLVSIVLEQKRCVHLREAYMTDFNKAADMLVSEYVIANEVAKSREEEKKQRQIVVQEREEHQRHLHQQLVQQRQAYEEKRSEHEKEKAREAHEQERMRKKVAVQERREFEQRLRALSYYLAAKQEMQKREEELAQLNAAQLERKRVLHAKRNALCVAKRDDERNQKMEKKKLLMQQVEKQRVRKEEALQRFFRSVDARLNVQADKARVLKSTEASKSAAPYITLAESAFSRSANGFASSLRTSKATPLHGYTDDEVMSDPRVRLYCALLDENLHKTEYGREVVNKLSRVSAAQAVSKDNPLRGEYREQT